MNPKIIEFAELIKENSGKLYLVGGLVRDTLLNIPNSDFDCEVFGIEAPQLLKICQEFGDKVDAVGESFGILKMHVGSETFDIALPRRERSTGAGHKSFLVNSDPFMSVKDAAIRRDFSINALYLNPLTGEILDFFGGREDIKNKIIRHVDASTFVEDSLRVLRACQFAARFNFSISADTINLCKSIDLSNLPAERIREELFKLLLKSNKPSIGIQCLQATLALEKLFPTLNTINLNILNKATSLQVCDDEVYNLTLMLAALLYQTTEPKTLLDKLQIFTINGYDVRKQVLLLLEHVHKTETMLQTKANYLRLANTGIDMRLLSLLGMATETKIGSSILFWQEYLDKNIIVINGKVKPILMGQHLLDLGYSAGPQMGKILKDVFEKQLNDEIHNLEEALNYVGRSYQHLFDMNAEVNYYANTVSTFPTIKRIINGI